MSCSFCIIEIWYISLGRKELHPFGAIEEMILWLIYEVVQAPWGF